MAPIAEQWQQGYGPMGVSGRTRLEIDTRETMTFIREMARGAKPAARRKYLKEVGIIILRQEDKIFRSRGRRLRQQWKPLSKVTISRRRKGSSVPLQDRGFLRASVSAGRATSGPKGAVRGVDNNSVTIGSNLHYARTHQYGRRRMRGMVKPHMRTLKQKRSTSMVSRAQRRSGQVRKVRKTFKTHVFVQRHLTWLPAIPARPFAGWTREGLKQSTELAMERFVIDHARKARKMRGR